MGAPSWKPGDTVWYAPKTGGPLYRSVVGSEPMTRMRGTWLVLSGLPESYISAHGLSDRRIVLDPDRDQFVFRRRPDDMRDSIPWTDRNEVTIDQWRTE